MVKTMRWSSRKENGTMTEQQITRYLELSARMLQIMLDSGVNWKPEYEAELTAIREELHQMRPLVDADHEIAR